MYNHNKAKHSKNRVHISWDILYICSDVMEKNWSLRKSVKVTGYFDQIFIASGKWFVTWALGWNETNSLSRNKSYISHWVSTKET